MSATFRNDYSDLAASEVLRALADAMDEKNPGYGYDPHCIHAEDLIKKCFGVPDGQVFFLDGGTQANAVVISYLLKAYECPLTVTTGHIQVHETGAVEATGHKIALVPEHDGKIDPADIEKACAGNVYDWNQKIRLLYITNATEGGTVYTKAELLKIREACDKCGLYLFIDGARLGAALTAEGNDVTPEDIGQIADVFYVGGTKNGALFGEAVVFKNKELSTSFRAFMKNKGALNAKGAVLGIQFEALFTDNLYFRLAKNANEMGEYIRKELESAGFTFVGTGRTNQLFLEFTKEQAKEMNRIFGLEYWTEGEEKDLMRIVTSFKTTKEECDELIQYVLKNCH